MAILDFEVAEKRIETRRGTFVVRGMNVEDLTYLTTHYFEDMVKALETHGLSLSETTLDNRESLAELFLLLVRDFPGLVAEMISRAAEEPDKLDQIRRIAFPVQLQLLHAITELTIEDAGGLGNLWAALRTLLEARGLRVGPLARNLQDIIEKHAPTSAS